MSKHGDLDKGLRVSKIDHDEAIIAELRRLLEGQGSLTIPSSV